MNFSKRTIVTLVFLGIHGGLIGRSFVDPEPYDAYVNVTYVGQSEGPDALSEPITIEVWSRGIAYPHDLFGKKPRGTFELSPGKEQQIRIYFQRVYVLKAIGKNGKKLGNTGFQSDTIPNRHILPKRVVVEEKKWTGLLGRKKSKIVFNPAVPK